MYRKPSSWWWCSYTCWMVLRVSGVQVFIVITHTKDHQHGSPYSTLMFQVIMGLKQHHLSVNNDVNFYINGIKSQVQCIIMKILLIEVTAGWVKC